MNAIQHSLEYALFSRKGTKGGGDYSALAHVAEHQFVSGPVGSFWLVQFVFQNISVSFTIPSIEVSLYWTPQAQRFWLKEEA